MPQLAPVRPPLTAPLVEHALWWATFNHRVLPLCSPAMGPHTHPRMDNGRWVDKPCPESSWGKIPLVAWKDKATKDVDAIRAWWVRWPTANIGANPDDGWVWVDVDIEDPGVTFPPTFKQTTGTEFKHHLLYRQPADQTQWLEQKQGNEVYWEGVDTRTHHGYVVASPSVHATGRRYAIANPSMPVVFPTELIPTELVTKTAKPKLAGVVKGAKTKDVEVVRLLNVIVDKPDDPTLGNEVFAKLASRLAKMCEGDLPMFRAWLRVANNNLVDPIHDSDLAKFDGIWTKTEETRLKAIETVINDGARGWLYEMGGPGYHTPVGVGDKLEYVPWSNFRVQAKSRINYGDHHTWIVDITKDNGEVLENIEIKSDVLKSGATLNAFLIGYGIALLAPTHDKRGNHGARLMCLLQSQEFDEHTVIDKYGWDEELAAFVTPDSLIRADSVTPCTNYLKVKDSRLHYGFDDGAVEALRTFLTFQDELAMSLFGSFLMATILRGHYEWQAPNLAVEAHAGSGKSTYLKILGQLCGVKREPGHFSLPVARDAYALSSNIFNWFDDVPMETREQELFRQSGTGGAYEIKDVATGFKDNKVIHLHASTVLSAERITFMEQKAMADRFLMVALPSADNRKSVTDPERSQWHDVSTWYHSHNRDLTRFAGTLVQAALKHVALFQDVNKLTTSTSRLGQMVAIMRAGARVLSAILDDQNHVARVDAWAETFNFNVSPSIVVNRVIPRVWNHIKQPKQRYYCHNQLHAVFFDEDQTRFWVSPQKLAKEWSDVSRRINDREAELTDVKAIELELKALGLTMATTNKGGDGKRWTSKERNKETLTYYPIPIAYTDVIYVAATGHTYEGEVDD